MDKDNLIVVDESTGEVINVEILESIKKKEYSDKVKRVNWLYENTPDKMTVNELEFLRSLRKKGETVRLDFKRNQKDPNNKNNGYCIVRVDRVLSRALSLPTLAVIYLASQHLTKDNKILFGNGRIIKNWKDLSTALDIPYTTMKKYKKELVAKNIIKSNKFGEHTYMMLNPLYVVSYLTISEDLFITFYEELKDHVDPLDFLYLYKKWGLSKDKN